MFRSHDHPQKAYTVPCKSYNLKQSVNSFVMLTLVLWQHVVFLRVSHTVFGYHPVSRCTTHDAQP